jgi:transposase InsO family protein
VPTLAELARQDAGSNEKPWHKPHGSFMRSGERKPSDRPPFDQVSQVHGVEHRLIKPGRPQTNGIVERFNGRISDVLATRRSESGEYLEQTLKRYCWLCTVTISRRRGCTQDPNLD